MKLKGRQMSDTFLLGALLGFAGGFTDAYTYLSRGHVFAYAQTGNMVLLALNTAEGKWLQAVTYAIPILTFALGVIVAECIRSRFLYHRNLHWRQAVLAGEIVILAGVAFLPESWNMAAAVLISFLSAMQVEAFRKVEGNAFASTMCTGNLRSGTEHLYLFLRTHDRENLRRCRQYYGVILFFIMGAGLGGVMTGLFAQRAALIGCLLLAMAFGLMFLSTEKDEPGGKRIS